MLVRFISTTPAMTAPMKMKSKTRLLMTLVDDSNIALLSSARVTPEKPGTARSESASEVSSAPPRRTKKVFISQGAPKTSS